ncbi:hypothetical protein TNCT_372821 [Trichonephila clavata]|uniref:Uncharacterized protein n=1 Tax=Trichonephila clavata TaxID=2740835 RepID=A0A8X6L968_TRICU|nr:hypothetical protein TNCT_372821 [Trichonephila clavata]
MLQQVSEMDCKILARNGLQDLPTDTWVRVGSRWFFCDELTCPSEFEYIKLPEFNCLTEFPPQSDLDFLQPYIDKQFHQFVSLANRAADS